MGIAIPALLPLPASAGCVDILSRLSFAAANRLSGWDYRKTAALPFVHRFKKELKKRKISLDEYTVSGETE